MTVEFDHLAVSCGTLDEGVAHVEAALGVKMAGGGVHPHFGTHNRLLSLGPDEYFEVIAIDPAASDPGRARWFDLDRFQGGPRLGNWILRCADLDAERARLGPGVGVPIALSRGDYRWRMAVPDNGILPYDNMHPALIGWDGPHPAAALPDIGCRLHRLVVCHPQAATLESALAFPDARVVFEAGEAALHAEIQTPNGIRVLT